MVSTSHLKLCHTPNVVPALPHWCSLPPGPVGLSGLPPCCPIGPASTPPAQSCAGGGGTTWLATPPTPKWGRVRQAPWSCNTFTSLSGGTCSTFTSHSGGTPFHPVPPHPPPPWPAGTRSMSTSAQYPGHSCKLRSCRCHQRLQQQPLLEPFSLDQPPGFLHIIRLSSSRPLASHSSRPLLYGLHGLEVWGEPL